MATNLGLMQVLASSSTATLYYDYSNSECFYLSGSFPTISEFSDEFSTEFGGGTLTGTYLVSAAFALQWLTLYSTTVYFNPFRLASANPYFTGFPTDPLVPVPAG